MMKGRVWMTSMASTDFRTRVVLVCKESCAHLLQCQGELQRLRTEIESNNYD